MQCFWLVSRKGPPPNDLTTEQPTIKQQHNQQPTEDATSLVVEVGATSTTRSARRLSRMVDSYGVSMDSRSESNNYRFAHPTCIFWAAAASFSRTTVIVDNQQINTNFETSSNEGIETIPAMSLTQSSSAVSSSLPPGMTNSNNRTRNGGAYTTTTTTTIGPEQLTPKLWTHEEDDTRILDDFHK